MNVYGQYKAATVKDIAPGHLFTYSDRQNQQPQCYICVRAVADQDKQGAVVLNGAALYDARYDDENGRIGTHFLPDNFFDDSPVLEINGETTVFPDLGSIADLRSVGYHIPNGALIYLSSDAFLTIQFKNRAHSGYMRILNVSTGDIRNFADEDMNRACICLKWDLLAYPGTPSQKSLYRYDGYPVTPAPAKTDEPASA